MVKSSASCLRIIACGSESVDEDGQSLPQSKSSSGRHGWKFRKRSARHRVLSNTVVSEVPSFANKASLESTTASNSQVHCNLTIPDNTSVVQTTQEKNELPVDMDSTVSESISVREDGSRGDVTIDGASIIIIQTAIRGYLAQQVLLKQKHAIKMQAAVRGHLVRTHAVGTLRCFQAIIKMQTLVRQRRTCLLERSVTSEKQNGESGKSPLKPMILRSREAVRPTVLCTYTSIEKLLSNKFAGQLMESIPRTQPINIKCEPLKSDSTWKWLERWMSASLTINDVPADESGSAVQKHEKEDCEPSEGKEDILLQSGLHFEPATWPLDETSENNDLITHDSDKFDLHACSSISPSSSPSKLQYIDGPDSGYDITQSDPTGMKETVLISRVDTKSLPDNKDAGTKQYMPQTEAEKCSLKASNPSLVAIPSKHEELNLAGTSSNSTTLLDDNPGVQPSFNSVSTGPPFGSRELRLVDASISNISAVQVARSECGTELSISSTLDLPDRPENGANTLEQRSAMLDATGHPESRDNSGLQANDNSHILGTELSYPNMNELGNCQGIDSASGVCVTAVMVADLSELEKTLETNQSNLHDNLESDVTHLVRKPSPDASPFTASLATPSDQISNEPEKSTGEKREAKRKNKRFFSTGFPNHNSPISSSEKLPNEHKIGKRSSFLGSAKPNHAHQEPRDSCSSDSLPSYMQATESARAKAIISNGSPRSSPDMHDKDVHAKNRGSLPGTNARQGSPRVRQSLSSPAQQNVKAHSPQERKWRL